MRHRNAGPALDLIAESAQGVAFLAALAEWIGTPIQTDDTGATAHARLYRVSGSMARGVLIEAEAHREVADRHTHRWGFYREQSGDDSTAVVAELRAFRRHSPLSGLRLRESSRRLDTFTLTFGPVVGIPETIAGVPWRDVVRMLGGRNRAIDVTDRALGVEPEAAPAAGHVVYAKEGREGRDFWRLDAGGHAIPLTPDAAETLIAEGATVRYVHSTTRTIA